MGSRLRSSPLALRVPRTVEFFGEQIELADSCSEWALMEFADTAERVESESLPALAAAMRLLREAVAPKDWARFTATARKNKATAEQCLPVIVAVFEVATDRPTSLPADSSDGQRTTAPNSTGASSSPAILPGRPDLQIAVLRAREAS